LAQFDSWAVEKGSVTAVTTMVIEVALLHGRSSVAGRRAVDRKTVW
jgi:hypothetical protein